MANRRPPQHISFLLAAIALTAFLHALVPVPAAMAAPTTAGVEGLYETLEKDLGEIFHRAAHVTYEYLEDLLPSLGDGNGESGGTAVADAIRSIGTGSQTFSVATFDITAPLTLTTSCDAGGGWPVPCNNQACTTMAPVQPRCPSYSIQFAPACSYGTSTVLYQVQAGHHITMEVSGRSINSQAPFYACRNYQATSSMAAVLGLGWSGAQSLGLQRFSYVVASNLRISVSVGGGGAAVARPGSSSTGTAALLSNTIHPDLYYVSVTGINVGGDEVLLAGALDLRHDGSGGGVFLSTIMPFTLLETNVYWSLIKTLKAQLPQKSMTISYLNTKQLCYQSGTWTPPTITLVLDGGRATMKLRVENCWYTQPQDNSLCLAILPSPWPTGESVLGTMMQSGWRMTYDLTDLTASTLTFEWSSSSSSSSSSTPSTTGFHNSPSSSTPSTTVFHNSPSSSTPSTTVFHNSLLLLLMSSLTMFLNMQVS